MNETLSHNTVRSSTLGIAEIDALPNIYFQSRIDTNIHQHVDASQYYVTSHVYGHNADIC